MFAFKPRKDATLRTILIVVILFNAFSPVSTSAASGKDALPNTAQDIRFGLTLGARGRSAKEEVPILSEQIAQQAQQEQAEKPVRFKVWAEPAIYMPGSPISLHWKLQNLKPGDLANAALVIHAPTGLAPVDPNATYTPDGLVIIPLSSKKEVSEWNVADGTELPIYFTLELMVQDDLLTYQTVLIDQPKFSVEKNAGGKLKGLNDKVEVEIPANALDESLSFDIREPAPQTQPAISLTWRPLEIIAIGKDSKKNKEKFKAPIKIKVKYDETQIFDWDEKALTIYYYDQDLLDWFPLETTVDADNNTLTAHSDHLTVFDYKANNWQSQSLPTIDAFKVSDFTGAGTYAINIWTPPGPGGLQPSLALSYNSQVIDESSAYSQPSWVGMGWDIDTGAINRNMHGTDSDTADDTFSISAGGVSGLLLPISVSGTVTTYNTADQSFMKVQFDSATNAWTAWSKDGTKYVFSTTAKTNSSSGCSGTLDLTWRWSLTTLTDTHNNTLNYGYFTETKSGCSNQIAVYPDTITYPNNKYRIVFVRDATARTDYQTGWTAASSRALYGTKRLSEIQVQHNPSGTWTNVRRYVLSYAPNNATTNIIYPNFVWSAGGKTLTLRGVQEFGSDGSALPAVTFTHGDYPIDPNELVNDLMHLTAVDNGQGGQVQIKYRRWTYFDDANDDLRSLMTVFGTTTGTHPECVYSGGTWIYGTAWTNMSGGPFGCALDGSTEYLQVGYQQGPGIPAVVDLARRSIPENVAKPGGRYRLALHGGTFVGGTDINWGFLEWSTLREDIEYSDNVPSAWSLDRSLELPSDFNPSDTYLYLECSDCKIAKYQFALMPQMWRVVSRTVTVQPTGVSSAYTYRYDNATPNTTDNSAAALTHGNNALYTKMLREFRGHAMSQVVNPEGLATVNWFYQTDNLKGRSYDTLVMQQTAGSYDDFDSIDPTKWVVSGGTHTSGAPANNFDYAAQSVNAAATWGVSLARTSASVTSGKMSVAHVQLSGANAQGEVGLVNGGQFFGLTMQGNTATASNGTSLLSAGNFLKDEWYGVMFFMDATNGSRMRIWQLDNPANFGETVISGVGGGSWTFRDRVNNGTIWLDAYFEGVPYSETITRYNTAVQYDTIASNGIPDLAASGLLPFKELQVAWNTVTFVEQRNYNGDAKYVGTKQELLTYDAYGNLLTQRESAGDNGTWTLHRGTKSEFYPNNTAIIYIVALPARQVTLDCTGGSCDFTNLAGKKAESYSFYDSASAYTTPPIKGDLTRQRAWVQNTDYSQVSYGYDTFGNPTTQTAFTGYALYNQVNDPTGPQTTTTAYDAAGYNTYAISVTNPLSQVTQTGYNFALGLPTSQTDPNSAVTSATYDGFGRMKTVTAPGDTTPATLQVTYHDTRIPFQIDLTQLVNASAYIRLSRFYDGAGRLIQTQTVGGVVGGTQKNVVVDYQFNSAGRQIKQSVPNPITYNASPVFATQNFTQSTTTAFDILGRTLSVTQPNANVISYAYGDLTTTVTDPKLYATTTTSDVWGRATFVDAPDGPDVTYTYDVLNQLKTVLRGGKTTTINYDAAGHKLNMTDPDMGYWQYQYDGVGNLKVQTDNRSCVLNLNYDNLNRLTTKTSSGAGCNQQVSITNTYDDITNGNKGKGRRTGMTDSSGSTAWVYDARGRVTQETKNITGTSAFITSWTFNSGDLPITMTYPDSEVLTYGYNSDGSLNAVTSNTGGTYLASTQYDEAGRLKQVDYGASILRKTFNYFAWNTANQGGLLNTAVTTRLADSVTLQSFAYSYDKNANVSTIVDNQAGPQTQTFGYDSLNRLTSASANGTNGAYSETYQYDATSGNLSMKGGLSYQYNDPNHAHAVTNAGSNSYVYDPNGNMTQRNAFGQTFNLAYDAENRLVTASTGGMGMNAPQSPAYAYTFPQVNEPAIGQLVSYNFNPLQQSGSLTFNPIDDAYIESSNPTKNHGAATTLQVSDSPAKHFLLKFDVIGVNGQTVTNAKIRLYNVGTSDQGGDFYRVTDNTWQEETVTWNTAPTAETTLLASLGAVNTAQTWYEVDVTSLVTEDGTYSLRISSTSADSAAYSSKEGANPPQLVLTMGSTPTPTASATPSQTPTNTPVATDTPTNTPAVTATNTPKNSPTPSQTPTNTSIATDTPTNTPVVTATNTPKNSATPTQTFIPTNTFTFTPTTPAVPVFSNAAFTYDGDSKRVKSVISTNIATTTTYFVGNYYELTGGVITKYYYAGAQRIAMRAGGTLNFLINDHLGSTSLTTSSTGTLISELRYKAWGEERYASGSPATNYTYTGQYSYTDDFGLMYYGARWYDPTIGRFNQPDTAVPGNQGVQAWDRYAYTNNNPVVYTDPTGHWIETAFDLVSLAMTINDIRNEGWTVMNTVSLVTDVAAVVLPIVPAGVSQALRAVKLANKAANAVDTAADTAKLANKLDNVGDTIKNTVKKADDAGCNSFRADTPVVTLEGDRAIATLEIGNYVLAWNEADGMLGYYEVTDTIHHTDQIVTELIVGGEWIETTPEHPFYVEDEGWINAEDLQTGDRVRQADGTTGIVWLQWNVHKTQEMYNLTVDTAHTFFVGDGQWLVHNDSCPISYVFWSGGDKAKDAAATWAKANKGITLEMTAAGKRVEKLTKGMPWDKAVDYWDDVSEKLAMRARGDAHVFLTQAAAKRLTSTWARKEYPQLLINDRVRNIFVHFVD